MAKLSAIISKSCTVDVYKDTDPGFLVVDYRPSQFNEDMMKELEKISDNPEATDAEKRAANTVWIKRMVPSWNVEAEESTEKKPVYLPVEDEHIGALGLVHQANIIKAISEDLKLGE
jgi:hypothetical protein